MKASDLTGDVVLGPGDAVVQQPAARTQLVLQEFEVGRVVLHADVFGQPDRGDRVESGLRYVPVVQVPDLGEMLQSFVDDGLLAPFGLLPRTA